MAELIQKFNRHRLDLTKEFAQNKEIEKSRLLEILVDLQMDISDHESAFDLKRLSKQNISNIVKLFKDPAVERKHAKKYNIKWGKKDEEKKEKEGLTKNFKNKSINLQDLSSKMNKEEVNNKKNKNDVKSIF